MAIVTRRYQWTGVTQATLQFDLDVSVTLPALTYMAFVDVTYDDTITDAAAVDETMAVGGFVFSSMSPVDPPSLMLVANDIQQDLSLFTPTNYVDGLGLSYVGASQVQVALGRARSADDDFTIVLASAVIVDVTVIGAGGLDTGAEAADTWYFVYVIADSTGTNPPTGLLSIDATSPTLPSGYDECRRVGSVRNNSSSDFINFLQLATDARRTYQYLDDEADRQVLTSGAAVVQTDVDVSMFVPPTTRFGRFEVQVNAASGTTLFAGTATANALRRVQIGAQLDDMLPTDAARQIAYQNAAASGDTNIWCTGFDEAI